MAKISISLAVLLVFVQGTCAYIWERTKTAREEQSKSDKLFTIFFTLTSKQYTGLHIWLRLLFVVNSCRQAKTSVDTLGQIFFLSPYSRLFYLPPESKTSLYFQLRMQSPSMIQAKTCKQALFRISNQVENVHIFSNGNNSVLSVLQ